MINVVTKSWCPEKMTQVSLTQTRLISGCPIQIEHTTKLKPPVNLARQQKIPPYDLQVRWIGGKIHPQLVLWELKMDVVITGP